MPRSGKLRWTARTVAVPLLLSLAAHGLLLLALWFWPTSKSSPALTIQSTRITLDTCVLASPPSTLLAERELPPELRGPRVDIALAPRVEMPASPPSPKRPVPGSSSGNGNNEGEKIGNGMGKGNGNGNPNGGSLFPVPATAASVVYVLDRSVSMGIDRKLDFARGELIASLRRLPPSVRFQVIDYTDYAKPLVVDGQRDLLPAEPATVAKAIAHLQTLGAAGNTNHLAALRLGIALRPDVLYFLTDAENLKPEDVAAITRLNQRTVVYTIELTRRRAPRLDGPLAHLARDNRGSYRHVWLDD